MRPPFYVRQLRRDLDDWIARGLVPESSRAPILDLVGADKGISLAGMLGVLGAILIGAAAMSFVAANWLEMSKIVRLTVLFGGMWLAYAISAWLTPARPTLSQAFLLLGVLMFGANIMLVAQTYHINAHFPDGVLLWGLGALAAAYLAPSRACLALALVLGGLWTWFEHFDYNNLLHLPFLAYWALCAICAYWLNWRTGISLAALTLLLWVLIGTDGIRLLLGWSYAEAASIYVFVPLTIWIAAIAAKTKPHEYAFTVEHYAVLILTVGYALLHIFEGPKALHASWQLFAGAMTGLALLAAALGIARGRLSTIDLAAVAFACLAATVIVATSEGEYAIRQLATLAATLLLLIWLLGRGATTEDRFIVNLALIGFGVWILYAYTAAFAAYLDQAVFLLAGGVLLIGLSLALDRLRRRLTPQRPKAAGAAS